MFIHYRVPDCLYFTTRGHSLFFIKLNVNVLPPGGRVSYHSKGRCMCLEESCRADLSPKRISQTKSSGW